MDATFIFASVGLFYGLLQLIGVWVTFPKALQVALYSTLALSSLIPWVIMVYRFLRSPESRIGVLLDSVLSAMLSDQYPAFEFWMWERNWSLNRNFPNPRSFKNVGGALFVRGANETENRDLRDGKEVLLDHERASINLFSESQNSIPYTYNKYTPLGEGAILRAHRCHVVQSLGDCEMVVNFYPSTSKLTWGVRAGRFDKEFATKFEDCKLSQFRWAISLLSSLTVNGYLSYKDFRVRRGANICHAKNIIKLWKDGPSTNIRFEDCVFNTGHVGIHIEK